MGAQFSFHQVKDSSNRIYYTNSISICLFITENCNYAIKLGKEIKFSLVGIDGKDINDGNETLTLALVWQLMKAYTLSILAKLQGDDTHPIVDAQIVEWANNKLKMGGKESTFRSFQDHSLNTGRAVIDLIDVLKQGSVNYDVVKDGHSEQVSGWLCVCTCMCKENIRNDWDNH